MISQARKLFGTLQRQKFSLKSGNSAAVSYVCFSSWREVPHAHAVGLIHPRTVGENECCLFDLSPDKF